MKIGRLFIIVALCLSLCGCDALSSGSHIFIETRNPQSPSSGGQATNAKDYHQLFEALAAMVANGTSQKIISVDGYEMSRLEKDIAAVVNTLRATDPIAAYAVEEIRYTIGTSGGADALSVEILYLHDKAQLRRIVEVADMDGAKNAIAASLRACEASVVLYIHAYTDADFTQVVEDYAFNYPEYVMELPQVAFSVYPETGESRVVELKFNYHTSRESLKNMQSQVAPVFESAVLYVSGDAAEQEKYSQLDSFLMERYTYTLETSITPTYSLLRHGVGDARAFATVYAAMCRQASLPCLVVTGTFAGESHYWNIVTINGMNYHIDLLHSDESGELLIRSDEQMRADGYLWDFDAYPVCGEIQTPLDEQTAPEENNEK